jgi:DNA polymerase III subunit delta'
VLVESSSPEQNLQRVRTVFEAREQLLEFNVTPALALESMMLGLYGAPR